MKSKQNAQTTLNNLAQDRINDKVTSTTSTHRPQDNNQDCSFTGDVEETMRAMYGARGRQTSCRTGVPGSIQPPEKRKRSTTDWEPTLKLQESTAGCSEAYIGTNNKKHKPCQKPKLACPYFKRDPAKYCAIGSCTGPGFDTIARLKEHLYRRHAIPKLQCPRCFQVFEKSDILSAHARSLEQCTLQESDPFERFGQETLEMLKSRKRSGIDDREAKWVETFQILFPGDDVVPSPYYDHEKTPGIPAMDQQQALLGYEDYIRELSPQLREELKVEFANELGLFVDGLKERAVDVFQGLTRKTLSRYKLKGEMVHAQKPHGTPDGQTIHANMDEGFCSTIGGQTASSAESGLDWESIFEGMDFSQLEVPLRLEFRDLRPREECSVTPGTTTVLE